MSLPVMYYLFMCFVVAQRVVETYSLPKRDKGQIYYSWSLVAMTALHLGVVFGSIAEFYCLASKRGIILAISILGVVLYFSGLLLRNWAKRTLAKQWSLQIEIQKDHRIVRDGPFQYIRHAAYLAILMEIFGIPLVSNAYWTLLFAALPYALLIVWRARVEEQALIDATGWEYIKFQIEKGAFFPSRIGIVCFDRRSGNSDLPYSDDRRQSERRKIKQVISFPDQRKIVRTKR